MNALAKNQKKKREITGTIFANSTVILFLILIAVVAAGSAALPTFRNFDNIMNVFRTSPIIGIVAVGATFVLITGEIDLSLGSILSLSLTLGGMCLGYSEVLGLAVTCAVGTGLGVLNGMIVAKAKISSLMVTLGASSVYSGIASILVRGKSIYLYDAPIYQWVCKGTVLKLPFPMVFFMIVSVAAALILSKTVFGHRLYYVGANPKASLYSGLPVDRIKIAAYGVCGLLTAVAGPILASQTNRITPIIGSGYELSAISVAVLGGTILDGGKGNVLGTFVGAIVYGLLLNILSLSGMGTYVELVLRGVLLVGIVAVFGWIGRKQGISS